MNGGKENNRRKEKYFYKRALLKFQTSFLHSEYRRISFDVHHFLVKMYGVDSIVLGRTHKSISRLALAFVNKPSETYYSKDKIAPG